MSQVGDEVAQDGNWHLGSVILTQNTPPPILSLCAALVQQQQQVLPRGGKWRCHAEGPGDWGGRGLKGMRGEGRVSQKVSQSHADAETQPPTIFNAIFYSRSHLK